jgi:nucleoside-diphosphate-sugar epimerase
MSTLVAGAGGFVGGHLVGRLCAEGVDVRAVDLLPLDRWASRHDVESIQVDLRDAVACRDVVAGCDAIYDLAADMGGMGFIASNPVACMLSVGIGVNLLEAADALGVERFFFSSSACVYPRARQEREDVEPLREDDAVPADPEDGYGWEKLFMEQLAQAFRRERGLEVRIARYHNVYGPACAWDGGREKAPAAICRKVAMAELTGDPTIDIWGDGRQTRSFTWIGDCVEGTRRLMDSTVGEPRNIGSSELVSIDDVVTMVEEIAGVRLERRYDTTAPQGVRGRNSDNTRICADLGWQPTTPLREGLAQLYPWVRDRVEHRLRTRPRLSQDQSVGRTGDSPTPIVM